MTRAEIVEQLRAGPHHDPETTHRLMLLAADVIESSVDLVADVQAFHEKFGVAYDGPPRVLPLELAEFRREFHREEAKEYEDWSFVAAQSLVVRDKAKRHEAIVESLAEMLDAIADGIYVYIGTAIYHGFDLRGAWRRVQTANMAKVRAEKASDSKRGTTYDVVKPPGWTAPDHQDLVSDHAHRR